MIVVTRLNDSQFAINPDLIERIHESPDTTLVMLDGAKYIVTESLAEVIARITEYRARVINLASAMADDEPQRPAPLRAVVRPLGLVTNDDRGDATTGTSPSNAPSNAPRSN